MQPGDVTLLDCLRKSGQLTVSELGRCLGVTATAVRQRLTRLIELGLIQRNSTPAGRGRPSFRYTLTERGRRKTGTNFADLAIALWDEIRSIEDPEVRRGLLQRLSSRLAEVYANEIEACGGGSELEPRMRAVAELLGTREVPFEVKRKGQLPVLTALSCPYTELAEKDRSICAMERMLFTELVGQKLSLSSCRLDGEACCTFELADKQSLQESN